MKKLLKNRLFIIIVTMIICISGTIYAVNKYQAYEVIYNKKDGTTTDVNKALDELYENISFGDATSEDIANGKTAIVKGKMITGIATDNKTYISNSLNNIKLIYSGGYKGTSTSIAIPNDYDIIIITFGGRIYNSGNINVTMSLKSSKGTYKEVSTISDNSSGAKERFQTKLAFAYNVSKGDTIQISSPVSMLEYFEIHIYAVS